MKERAFSIVELLIVITTIGILATIVVVSYNGIQARSFDASVQSDLDGMSGLFESFRVNSSSTHQFPRTKTPDLDSLNINISKNPYDATVAVNLVYCINTTDYQSYAIVALSKSGTVFMMTQDGLRPTTIVQADFTSGANICNTKLGLGLVSSGMFSPGSWQSWTGG